MTFNKKYFLITIFLFVTEVVIGAFVRDSIIRPYGGDFLVVMLVYCFVKSFFKVSVNTAAIGSLLFAYLVETGQYYHLVYRLGWGNSKLATTVMGTYFTWNDIAAYTLGIAVVLILERIFSKHQA